MQEEPLAGLSGEEQKRKLGIQTQVKLTGLHHDRGQCREGRGEVEMGDLQTGKPELPHALCLQCPGQEHCEGDQDLCSGVWCRVQCQSRPIWNVSYHLYSISRQSRTNTTGV